MGKVLSLAVCGYEKEGGLCRINERVAWDAVSATEMAPSKAGGRAKGARTIHI